MTSAGHTSNRLTRDKARNLEDWILGSYREKHAQEPRTAKAIAALASAELGLVLTDHNVINSAKVVSVKLHLSRMGGGKMTLARRVVALEDRLAAIEAKLGAELFIANGGGR